MAFIPVMSDSAPSKPKRFSDGNFEETNRSKESDQTRRSNITRFCSFEYEYLVGSQCETSSWGN